jgi:hypothetical protein
MTRINANSNVMSSFIHLQWFIVNIHSALRSLYHVNVDNFADVSEINFTSIFRVKVSRMCMSSCIAYIAALKY